MSKSLSMGKLPAVLLDQFIRELPIKDQDVLIPPGIGRDAAGVKIGERLVAVTTDPITFTSNRLATYSVSVNINDVACLGCRPRFYSGVLLLPTGTSEDFVASVFKELGEQLRAHDICDIGGHVEVTDAVSRPVLIGQMIGEAISDRLIDPASIQAGDSILLCRPIAIEGTAIIASEEHIDLTPHFSKEEIAKMRQYINHPGICIWPCVEKLLPNKDIVALHDPTEGGLATALHELSDAAGFGLKIEGDAIPILPETEKLAELFQIDPLGLIASGCLIIVCKPGSEKAIIQVLKDETVVKIGEFTKEKDRHLIRKNQTEILPKYEKDLLIKVLNSAK